MKKNSIFFLLSMALISSCGMSLQVFAQTVIGGNTPDQSAMLDVQSNNSGVLFPRMTTAQRDGINNGAPATGLMIFNTTTQCLEINLGATTALWQSVICPPPPPLGIALNCTGATLTGNLIPNTAASAVTVNVPYTGGNGGAYEGQSVVSTGVTGLTATLAPGTLASGAGSFSYAISGTPSGGGSANFALNIGGQTCTLMIPLCGAYVAAGVWKQFSCYNLGAVGATTGADPFTPSWELNGDYYQWGSSTKAADGPSAIDVPNNTAPAGWSSTAPATSWNDLNTDNSPCPLGFRVPSQSQWQSVLGNNAISDFPGGSWTAGINNYTIGKFFGPGLFLPASGFRLYPDGSLLNRGSFGIYWSSTAVGSVSANNLVFQSGAANMDNDLRANAPSVRCIAD